MRKALTTPLMPFLPDDRAYQEYSRLIVNTFNSVLIGASTLFVAHPTSAADVDEIVYSGGKLDALYMNKVSDERIRFASDIFVRISGSAASGDFLARLIDRLPNENDKKARRHYPDRDIDGALFRRGQRGVLHGRGIRMYKENELR